MQRGENVGRGLPGFGLFVLAAGGPGQSDRPHRLLPLRFAAVAECVQSDPLRVGGPTDVMICHDAPTGIGYLDQWLAGNGFHLPETEQAYADDHRQKVRSIVDTVQPAHLWHGHYHIRYDDTLTDTGRDDPVRVHGLAADGDDNLVICRLTSTQEKP